ncbi:hypothetical protein EYE40_13565 [Glaciihabitans arcticus]|uniref:Adenylyl-sulfate kinase n=1 Tax=Glaciihabitans arcticus TaxID=2668039 RepID=A0A4Q9GYK3_9MICO|nr:AAA family ATPase [Glaciihabitans arcticus]TBN58337.1 hypothetical protein EYE40_13565 [Glaciihabitans arcticus]
MDTIFINGTVGVGKTTLAEALSELETEPHAIIDLDAIRRLYPAPPDDPFRHELELENLAAIAVNYRRAGAERFIVAGVIEEADEVRRYVAALRSTGVFVCRLVARPDVLEARIRRRHADDPDGMTWHLTRAGELAKILEEEALDDLVLDASDASPVTLANDVRRAAWA